MNEFTMYLCLLSNIIMYEIYKYISSLEPISNGVYQRFSVLRIRFMLFTSIAPHSTSNFSL